MRRPPTYEKPEPNGVRQTYSVRLTFATAMVFAGEEVPLHTTPTYELPAYGMSSYRPYTVRKKFLTDNAERLNMRTNEQLIGDTELRVCDVVMF